MMKRSMNPAAVLGAALAANRIQTDYAKRPHSLDPKLVLAREIAEHNAAVDARKREKKMAKLLTMDESTVFKNLTRRKNSKID